MNQVGERIKILLVEADENQINILVDLVNIQLVNKLKFYDSEIKEVPPCLEYVVVESVISRYNYLGSEGMSSESVEGHSMTFEGSYLDKFDEDIKQWAEINGFIDNGKGKVIFL